MPLAFLRDVFVKGKREESKLRDVVCACPAEAVGLGVTAGI